MKQNKNQDNEYKLDGKRWFKEITECTCNEKIGDIYVLNCRIIQYGTKEYSYIVPNDYINFGNRKIYLEPPALKVVRDAVEDFEKRLAAVSKDAVEAYIDKLNFTCCFQHKDTYVYSFILKKEHKIKLYEDFLLFDMLHEIFAIYPFWIYRDSEDRDKLYNYYNYPTIEDLEENSLYIAAGKSGDELMQQQMRIRYNLETIKDCKKVADVTDKRILPQSSAEFDKNYYVRTETVDVGILKNSGYSLSHKVNYAMRGYTRKSVTLNPHLKIGTDAAPENEIPITFEEYLKIFESC